MKDQGPNVYGKETEAVSIATGRVLDEQGRGGEG